MAGHARLKNEFTENVKYHNLMTWLKWLTTADHRVKLQGIHIKFVLE